MRWLDFESKMSFYNSLIVILILCSGSFGYQAYQDVTKQNQNTCVTPDTQLGNCVTIKNCPHLYELLKTRGLEPEVTNFLRRSHCGTVNNSPKVCCNVYKNSMNPFVTSSPVPVTSLLTSNNAHNIKGFWHMIHSSSPRTTSLVTSSPVRITSPKTSNNAYDNGDNWNMIHSSSVTPSLALNTIPTTSHNDRQQNKVENKYAKCGKSTRLAMNIIGGRNATLGDWPWMVALSYRTSSSSEAIFKCGGSLISDRWVLTASHCVQYIGEFVLTSVRLGDLNLNDDKDDGASPIDIPVDKIIPHPGFAARPAVVNDIALVRLRYPVTFTAQIRPICIAGKQEHRGDDFYSNKSPYIAGWGTTQTGGQNSDTLLEAQIDVINRETCIKNYAGRMVSIDQRVLCASRYGKDACQGDSGGPLMIPIKASYYLIGIVSYGIGCGDNYFPGVYTKVAYFADWIRSTAGIEF